MTIRDVIKKLIEFNLDTHIAFDVSNLIDSKGENGGHPNVTSIEIAGGLGGDYILLKSDEI